MHFKIKDFAGKRSAEKFIQLPPAFQKKLVFLRWVGGAFAYAIENRVKKHKTDAQGRPTSPFNNSGGMWKGWSSGISGKGVVIQFHKSSFPSAWARRAQKKFKDPEDREKWLKRMQRAGKTKRVRNRKKAQTASDSMKTGHLTEPSRDEINALLSWARTHTERTAFSFFAESFKERPRPDRYRLVLSQMPDPKSTTF
tara:strand:+ start:189 stop:779 length:591 start_codon:yes stop_codon:yes gene_type:complete